MAPCQLCPPAQPNRAILRRPKTLQPVCQPCFFRVFETEIHHAIMGYGQAEQLDGPVGKGKRPAHDDEEDDEGAITAPPPQPRRRRLFRRGEKVAIGASGGKDSTVLAYVMKLLNERYDYGLDLCLLSIDEGISGYRDASLDTVKRNAEQYDMPLKILSYSELYGGWTMDKVVAEVGKKGNCTYCGVFRRQAIDRGANILDVDHIVTGHNADDVAETVLMNGTPPIFCGSCMT
ncbi:cytosolic thiouridylase subunit Ctu1 [Rhodotorula sphaerocarpa]